MTPNELLKHYGTKADIGRAAGVDRQVVHGWFERGSVPLDHQTSFEVATDGKLKADVSEEFRKVVQQNAA